MITWGEPDFTTEDLKVAINSLNNYIGSNGIEVDNFEKNFAKKMGVSYAVATNNATSALVASCMVIKHMYGDITIGVPNFSFIATANSAKFVFNNIKFLDIDRETWNIDVNKIDNDIQAIIPVDVGGLPCDYDSLMNLGIPIIADSAESAGSKYKNKYVGSQCPIHCFSLHRSKIISCGEGGIITTNDENIYTLLKSFINHGYDLTKKSYEYKHNNLGLNFRMCDVNAAIANSQLNRLDDYVKIRQNIANFYLENLPEYVETQKFDSLNYDSNYFFFGILVDKNKRERIINKLYSKNIQVKTWSTLASQNCYKQKDLIVSSDISERIILLPIHNKLTIKECNEVVNQIKKII